MTAGSTREERLGAAAQALSLDLSDAVIGRLLRYLDLLQRWNGTYNLTAVRDPDEMLTQHLVDCLAAVSAMNARLGDNGVRILDVGSGGGLPGVVIALVRPQDRLVCVDTVGKKAAFIRQVAVELALTNLDVEHARVESLRMSPFDLVTSRAFSSLRDLVRLTERLIKPTGMWMAMKGKLPAEEIRQLPAQVEVFHVEHLQVPGLAAERCLIWMRPRTRGI